MPGVAAPGGRVAFDLSLEGGELRATIDKLKAALEEAKRRWDCNRSDCTTAPLYAAAR
jgi:hypothetical protein